MLFQCILQVMKTKSVKIKEVDDFREMHMVRERNEELVASI